MSDPGEPPAPTADAPRPDARIPAADAARVDEPVITDAAPAKPASRVRRRVLMVSLPLVLALAGAYFWVTGGRYVNTEDAYVQQDRVSVVPQVSGQIASIGVEENEAVTAGQTLFTIDDMAFRTALESTRAKLESARLDVQKLKAAYARARSEESTARDALATTKDQDGRQQSLRGSGVISQSVADDSALQLQRARGEVARAESQVQSASAALAGNPDIAIDDHPEVLEALADVHQAELDLAHATVGASEAGVASQTDRLQVGQYVTPATPVLSVVQTDHSWIEANFKETDLTHMAVGQAVTIELDTYPDRPLQGVVASIGAGTGSEFALLPAQNATGNWVKVVQRVPVRIRLDETNDAPLLRAGMSASVDVDTGHARGLPDVFGSGDVVAER